MGRSIEVSAGIGGTTVVARCASEQALEARTMIERGFGPLAGRKPGLEGAVVVFGWAAYRLERREGQLLVCEPDFDEDPRRFRPDVTASLRVVARQVGLVKMLGIKPEGCRFDDKIVADRAALHAPAVYLHRTGTAKGGDSGWYMGRAEAKEKPSPEELAGFMSCGLVRLGRERLLDVLALPVGYIARFDGDTLLGIADARSREVYSPKRGRG
ncbi:hypothetical protein [Polyangium fumosum]|uniref:Imm33-like domain-containing protein n=1 Tax=Polyangium fumosum TaxID=889272 RepID=A0A4U1ISL7_9BACT|nr:hypothetical protein [Polyangium fumosum]TKC97263.1 hypothetical protein E8A74_43910 [Polyangium fumosum]